ncbi:hypothetical protein KP509_04G103500 [Ceratopteris richardii]|nr:hypothetical protein KP509_04G103500 [Ceratopteris richardii]KAH7440351.1 hypothetical protein KP509_04G103500 [Ceratopteris richardii]KAH7440353.1 hypothetical protein KP509_04G103500 [Ceratopteris richardii]
MEKALEEIPWSLLDVSEDVREQVDLVHGQFKRAKEQVDSQDIQLYGDLMLAISQGKGSDFDLTLLRRLANELQLKTLAELEAEVHALQNLMEKHNPEVDGSLEQMLDLMKQMKKALLVGSTERVTALHEEPLSPSDTESICATMIPDDYLCPISLEIMNDPVIIATGQTYERANIQKWLEENRTCPKTSQVLAHTTLTPNFVLRSLINQWREANGLEISAVDSISGAAHNSSNSCSGDSTIDELIAKLSSRQIQDQRAATAELRLLAKNSAENRIRIAEAGAIPHLVALLTTHDVEVLENAITALLNVSIHDHIKGLVVQAGAIPHIVTALKYGSMKARENAAATLFSLSTVNEHKLTIGALGAIPPLVDLLKHGSPQGKKDAASALFNLLIYQGNKPRAVRAGVVKPIIALMSNSQAGMRDEAVSILALLSTHEEGRRAISRISLVPALMSIFHDGSPRTKENAAAILLALVFDNPQHLTTAGRLGIKKHLVDLVQSGTERAKRKASRLLEHLAMLQAE